MNYNKWFDGGDKITEENLIASAQAAADIGCELYTVDAGWFGQGLNAAWTRSLGDWEVNQARLPNGLEPVIAEVRRLGMKFGLWLEIECASPDSKLGKQHPDWYLLDDHGRRVVQRAILDFGNPAVLEHVKGVIDRLMQRYHIDYLKNDFNMDPRVLENQRLTQASEPLARHYRGLAEFFRYVREKYPALIIENCAGGATRQELTSVALTDTHWVSDLTDNRCNLLMPFGVTYLMPPSICSHWTVKPERDDPMIDLDAQFAINLMGHLGLSAPIAKWDAEIREIVKNRIADYKRIRPIICNADVFHLTPQGLGHLQAALYADASTGRALLFAFHSGDPELKHTIPLRGLDPAKSYRVKSPPGVEISPATHSATDAPIAGKLLVEQGLTVVFPHTGAAAIVEIEPATADR